MQEKHINFNSGVARAFPGGRAAHPKDQNEEENEENLRKNERNYRKMRKGWVNILILPTQEWEAGYGPKFQAILIKFAQAPRLFDSRLIIIVYAMR